MQAVTRIKPRESLRPWFELPVLYHDQWTTTNPPPPPRLFKPLTLAGYEAI